jgi:hypothetical protein
MQYCNMFEHLQHALKYFKILIELNYPTNLETLVLSLISPLYFFQEFR